MNIDISRKKKRKVAAATTTTTIIVIVAGIRRVIREIERIPRAPYVNRDSERRTYLNGIINDNTACHRLLRLNAEAFHILIAICRDRNILHDNKCVSIEEQMAEFLHTIGHNEKNRVVNHNFKRLGETISRYFHIVLQAVLSLHKDFVVQPNQDTETPFKIRNSNWFFPWFKDCVGAIDGTHVRVVVDENIQNRFRRRKEKPTQNILAAVSFDLKFTYILAGWEGSAHDSPILHDAVTRPNGLSVPEGRYYLVDAEYTNKKGFLAPYHGFRYHSFDDDVIPDSAKELFNIRHASLRNTVERAFGVLKKRWKILDDSESFYSYETQVDIILACCIIHNFSIEVDPNDAFVGQVDEDMQRQASTSQSTNCSQRMPRSQREQHEENREWNDFRLNIVNNMWDAFQ